MKILTDFYIEGRGRVLICENDTENKLFHAWKGSVLRLEDGEWTVEAVERHAIPGYTMRVGERFGLLIRRVCHQRAS